ncbi:TolC family protein [Erwinia sp. AnSW2-5]|uniref:TolC family protein n=1 Tax=Erwinia sp. AnSW2-5 TaxID=3367692 RepID=UPI00385A6CB0
MAGLLPIISLDGSDTKQDQFHTSYAAAVKRHNYGINLSQPLLDISKIAAFHRSNVTSDLADIEFIGAQQKLIRDVIDAFLWLFTNETSQKWLSPQQKYSKNSTLRLLPSSNLVDGNRTEVDEAQANYNEAAAGEITARNDLDVSNAAWNRLTGLDADAITPISTQCYPPSQLGELKNVILLAQSHITKMKKATQQRDLTKGGGRFQLRAKR